MSQELLAESIGLSKTDIEAVRRPLAEASLLPSKIYSDRAIFEAERERIFAKSWLPVCHVSSLEKAGDFVARTLVGEAVIAVRGRDDGIRVMSNVCRHRNTVLTRGSGSCKGGRIMCPYHGWTYGLDGKLLAAPFMEEAKGFARRSITLPEFKSEIWHGFLFVNFDEDARPLLEQVAPFEAQIAPYRFEDMEAFELRRSTLPWNWKISLENFSEAYHQPWVHPKTADHDFPASMAKYYDTNNSYSVFSLFQRNGEAIPLFSDAIEGLSDSLMKSITVFNLYPYMHGLTDPATPLILDFNIVNENEHELVWTLLLPKGSRGKLTREADLENFRSFIEPILTEDTDVCTDVGLGVRSRFTVQGRLSHMEKSIHQFHLWWLDKMVGTSANRTVDGLLDAVAS